jgi:hypothetical protein
MRPKSIVRFEQLFFVNLVLGIAIAAVTWNARMAIYHSTPNSAVMGDAFPVISLLIGYVISLALWFFIARRGSVVAKWIYVVFFAIGVLGLLATLGTGMARMTDPLSFYASILSTLISAAAVYFLFQRDTRPWFGESAPSEPAGPLD